MQYSITYRLQLMHDLVTELVLSNNVIGYVPQFISQIREFQMASSADELESEDPDDELELDDDPEPASRVEDCSVVIPP